MSINPSPELTSLFETALNDFEKRAGITLDQHPITDKLVTCESADSIIEVLQEQAQAFRNFRGDDGKIMTWLKRTVNVLCALSTSDVLAEGVGLPFPPARAIFAGIAVLLSAIKDVGTSYDALVDLFESFEAFLRRLDIYTKIPSTPVMTEIIVKILVELLSTISLAIKQAKQGRLKKLGKKFLGENEIEAVLQRLDRLTQEEARTTATQTLEVVYGLVKNIKAVMDDGSIFMDDVHRALVLIQQLASDVNKSRRDQLQVHFRVWLAPPDPSTNHNIAQKAHHEGSAEWFIHGNIYRQWKVSTGSLLWIHGKPGSGKTVFSSTIIEDLKELRKAGLASVGYFYFDFKDQSKQDSRSALSSLLIQLASQSDAYCESLSALYSAHDDGCQQPSEQALRECLRNILMLRDQGPIFIVLDAIDECPNSVGTPSPRENVLGLVEWLSELQDSHVSICIASRPETDIEAVLQPLASHTVSLHGESGQNEDIINYIKWFLITDPKARKWKKEDKELVLERLSKGADGMFRWVFCQLDRLRRCLSPRIRRALDELPETLDETYERTLLDIDEENWEYAHRLFQCVVVARRPLQVEELAEFLAFKSEAGGAPTFEENWQSENPRDMVLSTCSSLVAIIKVDGMPVIQFSHYSVKEYLTSSRVAKGRVSRYHIPLERAHLFVTQACLSILLQLDKNVTKKSIEGLRLVRYAGQHWADHAELGSVSSLTEDMINLIFNPEYHHFANWVWIYDTILDRPGISEVPTRPDRAPIHYAARHGFHRVAKWLITTCSQNGRYTVPALLTHRAYVNAVDQNDWTPLHFASWHAHPKVVQLLLDHDADVDSKTKFAVTPLRLLAEKSGNLEVAQLLLDHGADPNSRTWSGCDSLYMALERGDLDLLSLLLKRGGDPSAQDVDGKALLHVASQHGDLKVVQGLLDLGVDINMRNNQGLTSLQVALQKGNEQLVQLLLQHGAKRT